MLSLRGKYVKHLPPEIAGKEDPEMPVWRFLKRCSNKMSKIWVINNYNVPLTLAGHSWFDMACHVQVRLSLKRGRIQELIVDNHRVLVKVLTAAKDIFVDPLHILLAHVTWLTNHVISDDEPDSEEDEEESTRFNAFGKLRLLDEKELALLDTNRQNIVKHSLKSVSTVMTLVDDVQFPSNERFSNF